MVIGGLTANMLFTRMVIPVGYLLLERRKTSSEAYLGSTEGGTLLPGNNLG
jgi:hypothetical protein